MHPPAEYATLRADRPVCPVELPTGDVAWLVTRHADVRRLLADPRVSADRSRPGFPRMVEGAPRGGGGLLGTDPPEHTAHRRKVLGDFTVRRVTAMRPRIQEIVTAHIDAMCTMDRPLDLVQALSLPVPSLVICELLGVPYSDRDRFQRHTSVLVDHESPVAARKAARAALDRYMDELVTAQEADPGEDLLGRLVVRYRTDGRYDHERLVMHARVLLIAGHETTANMISLGTVALLECPDQLAELRKDPDLWPAAVEELLRFFSIIDHGTTRIATADIEIGGVVIRAGDGIVTALGSANRDAEVFPDPDRLDVRRRARGHVAFGFGPHQCLGQNLARTELAIVLRTLFERLPNLRLAQPVRHLPFKTTTGAYGLHRLPVTW